MFRFLACLLGALSLTLTPAAAAAQLMLLGVSKPGGAAPPAITVDYRGVSNTATSAASVFTLAGVSTGTAGSGRIICFAIVNNSSVAATVTSVTVDGFTPTLITDDISSTRGVRLYEIGLASGTSSTFVVTMSGGTGNVALIVYRIVTTQTGHSTASGSGLATRANPANNLATPAIVVPGSGVGLAFTRIGSATGSVVWTPTSGSGTTDANQQVGGLSEWVSSYQNSTAGSQSYDANGADTVPYIVASVSYAP